MDRFRLDLKLALRRLRARPTATFTIVLVLTLGIGATLVIAGVLDAVLIRPLDFPRADRLTAIEEVREDGARENLSFATFDDVRRHASSGFARVGAYAFGSVNLTGVAEPSQLRVARIGHGFFETLGRFPQLGRTIAAEENETRSKPVVVLSHTLWQNDLGGRGDVLGTTIALDGEPHEVIGVMPEGFAFPSYAEVWLPLRDPSEETRAQRSLQVIGRLETGTSLRAARSSLASLAANLEIAEPAEYTGRTIAARPLLDLFVADSRPMLIAIFCGVVGLLLIVCLNITTLETASALERAPEIAVRSALGAGRFRILRQLLTENLVLAGFGGIGGLLLASWGIDAVKSLGPESLPRLANAGFDLRLAGVAMLLSLAVGSVFGLVPALRVTRQSPGSGLRGGRGDHRGRRLLSVRNLLVASQVAISLALLVAAGLAGRSLGTMTGTDAGFDVDRLLSVGFVLPPDQFPNADAKVAWMEQVLPRVAAVPGVERVSTANFVPFTSGGPSLEIDAPGIGDGRDTIEASEFIVNPGYFATLGLELIAGRDFDGRDRASSAPVVVVNEKLAAHFGGATGAVGRTLAMVGFDGTASEATIVGVVADFRQAGVASAPPPQVYGAYAQIAWGYSNLVVRAAPGVAPDSLIASVHRAVWSVDEGRELFASATSRQYLEWELAEPRFRSFLLTFFSGFGLLLAVVGIYSVLAVSVRQRRREIGIRLALGAARQRVRGLVVREGMTYTALGVILGVPLALVAGRLLASQLVGVGPSDPSTLIAVAVVLLISAYAASAIPAARASRVDPMTTLREE